VEAAEDDVPSDTEEVSTALEIKENVPRPRKKGARGAFDMEQEVRLELEREMSDYISEQITLRETELRARGTPADHIATIIRLERKRLVQKEWDAIDLEFILLSMKSHHSYIRLMKRKDRIGLVRDIIRTAKERRKKQLQLLQQQQQQQQPPPTQPPQTPPQQ